jgi:hypothetical protein
MRSRIDEEWGFAGRATERATLGEAVDAALQGSPGAVLVRGEAGVGKTRLVEDACRHAREAGFAVLWGRCLRFGEVALPCLPLVGAFEAWLAGADAADRADVIAAAPGLTSLLPSLGSAHRDAARGAARHDRPGRERDHRTSSGRAGHR